MFDYIYEWIQNIAFYLVMVTVLMHIIPNSDYKKYIRFFTGLVLVVMMTGPILKLLGMGDAWQELFNSEEYQEQMQKIEDASNYLEEVDPEDYLGDIWENPKDGQANRDRSQESQNTGQKNQDKSQESQDAGQEDGNEGNSPTASETGDSQITVGEIKIGED